MDIPAFTDAVIAGVPLLFVVMGLTQWFKKLGVQGNALLYVSMAVGLLCGAAYIVASSGVPVDAAGWISMIVYGVGLGLLASGIYDAATTALRASRE